MKPMGLNLGVYFKSPDLSVSAFLNRRTLKSKNLPQIWTRMRRTRSQTKAISDPHNPQSPTKPTSSKISFRARKIPRLTSKETIINHKQEPTTIPIKAPSTTIPKALTCEGEIDAALHHLRNADSLLANCIDTFPPPKFTTHHSPFFSLTKNIISQQLSNKAAEAIENRFISLCGDRDSVGPEVVLALTAQQLRVVGISGPKASYLHDLASKYRDGLLSDSSILQMDDKTLLEKLTMGKGIGPWSVHMFMMFTLHRPDVLPVGDLGVRKGLERLYGLKALPQPSQMEKLCEKWKPYRSVGSWYMYRLIEAKGVLPTLPQSQNINK